MARPAGSVTVEECARQIGVGASTLYDCIAGARGRPKLPVHSHGGVRYLVPIEAHEHISTHFRIPPRGLKFPERAITKSLTSAAAISPLSASIEGKMEIPIKTIHHEMKTQDMSEYDPEDTEILHWLEITAEVPADLPDEAVEKLAVETVSHYPPPPGCTITLIKLLPSGVTALNDGDKSYQESYSYCKRLQNFRAQKRFEVPEELIAQAANAMMLKEKALKEKLKSR